MPRKKDEKVGSLTNDEIRKLINKQVGAEVAYDLTKDNPTEVLDWISTGSKNLDAVIATGKMAGIPVGKISEIGGLESCVTEDTLVEIIVDD